MQSASQSVHSQSQLSRQQQQQQQMDEERSVRSSAAMSIRSGAMSGGNQPLPNEEMSEREVTQHEEAEQQLRRSTGQNSQIAQEELQPRYGGEAWRGSGADYQQRDGSAGLRPLRVSTAQTQPQQFYLRDSSQGRYPDYRQPSSQYRPAEDQVARDFTRLSIADRFDPNATAQNVPVSPDDVRDRIINSYRDEIKNHQARERDFKILQEVIADLHRKVRGLENEIGVCQRDHEDRLRDQNKVIGHLQGDLEQIKRGIHAHQDEGIQVHDQIQAVKRSIDERNLEISRTSSDLENVRLHNDVTRRDIDQLHSDIAYQHDIKKKQQNGIFQLKGDLRAKEKEVEDQKLRLQVLEREDRQLQDRIRIFNENIDQRTYVLEKTSAKLDGTLRENDQVRGAVGALEYQVQEFVRSNGQATELQKRLFRQKDQEVIKNQDLDKGVRVTDQNIKDLELYIEGLNRDLEGMRYSNQALLERNVDLRQELESFNRHQRLIAEQNAELQRELDGFIETDEIVRRNLDRKDKVQQIRQQVDDVIRRSMVEVRSRSPIRGGNQRTFQFEANQQSNLPQQQQQQFPNSYNFGQNNNNQNAFELTRTNSPLRRTNINQGGY